MSPGGHGFLIPAVPAYVPHVPEGLQWTEHEGSGSQGAPGTAASMTEPLVGACAAVFAVGVLEADASTATMTSAIPMSVGEP
jgi:hypothetical protein